MKFSCNKCDTKYSIADEKVRGKVLKIRCKKCENIIVLREPKPEEQAPLEEPTRAVTMDPATLASLRATLPAQGEPLKQTAAAPAGGRQPPQRIQTGTGLPLKQAASAIKPATAGSSALAPEPAAQPSGVEWFLAIKGQQVGPLSDQDVRRKLQGGEADARTYGWRDGMADWKRLQDIPEFKGAIRPAGPPPPPPPTHPGAQVVDLQAEIARRQRKPSLEPQEPAAAQQPQPGPGDQSDPHGLGGILDPVPQMGAAPLAPSAKDPFASVPDSAANIEGPPRESTRMFIAAAGLANRGRKHKIYAAIGTLIAGGLGTIIYLDASGIYQIPIVNDLVSVTYAALDVERPPPKKRIVEADDDVSELWKGKPRPKGGGGHHKSGTKGGDGEFDLAGALAGAGDNSGTALAERAGDGKAADGELHSDLGTSAQLKDLLKAGADGRRGATPLEIKKTDATVEALANKKNNNVDTPLKPEQIAKVVADQKASLAGCANESAKQGEKFRGNVKVTVLIGPSGKVKKVTVNDPKIANMTLGQCLGRALMRWIFPRFEGEEFEAELPLKLSVGP